MRCRFELKYRVFTVLKTSPGNSRVIVIILKKSLKNCNVGEILYILTGIFLINCNISHRTAVQNIHLIVNSDAPHQQERV